MKVKSQKWKEKYSYGWMRRCLSLVMVLLMIVTLIPADITITNAASYNANAAVQYALQHAYNYNSAYPVRDSKNDCANFVSQCLVAGGLPLDTYWNPGCGVDPVTKYNNWYTTSLKDYLINKGYQVIWNPSPSQIQPGNPVFYSRNPQYGKTTYSGTAHAAICVSNTNGNNPKISAHTTNRNDYPHSYMMGYFKGCCTILMNGSSVNSATTSSPSPNNPDSYATPTSVIGKGSRGDGVRWVQAMLNNLIGTSLSVDGICGNGTANAIRSFQQRYGLSVDGKVGYYTRSKMIEVWESRKVVNPSSVALNTNNMELTVGRSAQLSANVGPANASNKSVSWSSNNTAVASVNNGTIYANGAGTANITVSTHNGKTATCRVSVHNPCTVTFTDEDGTVIERQNVDYGGNARTPKNPSKVGHTFSGWSGTYQGVRADSTVKATYTKNQYKVTFQETDGTKIGSVQKIYYNDPATAPEQDQLNIPDGYKFEGWSESFDHVTSDLTVYPVYKWADEELPLFVSAEEDACKLEGDGIYSLSFSLKNHSQKAMKAKVMTYMTTANGKLVAQGETRTVRVPAATDDKDGMKQVDDMVITCSSPAEKARIVVFDDYESAVPLADIKDVNVEAAGYGAWTNEAPTETSAEHMERTLYRSKKVNYTSSTSTNSMSGWTNYNTTVDHYDYGGWNYAGSGNDLRSNDTTRSEAIEYCWMGYAEPQGNVCSGGGDYVCWIQAALNRLGYPIGVDGRWGPNTAANVKSFQANNGLAVDGIVGNNTKNKMKAMVQALPVYRYYNRSKTPVYRYSFYQVDADWTDWQVSPISGDTSVKVGSTKVLVDTTKQYRYKEETVEETGVALTPSYAIPEDAMELAGKDAVAIVFKNKVSQISEDNVQYIGNTKISDAGKVDLSFIPREEQSYIDTGDYTVALGVKGTTNYIKLGVIEAEKPEYSVKFIDEDGTVISDQKVKEGATAEVPEVPEKEGYRFTGWNTGVTNVHDNLTIVAQYEKEKYMVTYVDWENKTIDQKEYEYGSMIELPDDPKAPEGYEFDKWSVKPDTLVTSNIICEASFKVPTHKVSFVDWDGKVIQEEEIEDGKAAMEPEVVEDAKESVAAKDGEKPTEGSVPKKVDGMTFVGWGENIDLSCVTTNLLVGAIYQFDDTVETPTASVKTGEYNKAQTVTLETETEDATIYYTLDGSDPSDAENTNVKVYTEPIVISEQSKLKFYAVKMGMNDSDISEEWYAINSTGNVPTHIVSVDAVNIYDDTAVYGYKGFVKDGEKIDVDKLLKQKYDSVILSGIYCDEQLEDEWQTGVETITDSLTLYAKYDAKKCNVTYKDEDGNILTNKEVSYGSAIEDYEAPKKEGYHFVEWISEDDINHVTKDIEVTASYIEQDKYVTIQFSRKKYSVMAGATFTLTPKMKYENGGQLATGETVLWNVDNPNIATIDDDGNLTALSKGEVTVTAKVKSSCSSATCQVVVTGNPEESICLYSNASYKLENNILRNIDINADKVSDIKKQINAESLRFVDVANVELKDDDKVGTGTRVQLLDDQGALLDEVTVVITGDYNGDGEITTKDVSGITRSLLYKEDPTNVQLMASDVNGDGNVNNRDAAMLSRYLVGKEELK